MASISPVTGKPPITVVSLEDRPIRGGRSCGCSCMQKIDRFHSGATKWLSDHRKPAKILCYVTLLILYHAYFIYAELYRLNIPLIIFTIILWIAILYYGILKPRVLDNIDWRDSFKSLQRKEIQRYMKLAAFTALLLGIALFIFIDTRHTPFRLVPLAGMLVLILVGWVFSTAPGRVNWQVVLGGITLQVLLGILVLRWTYGFLAFEWLSTQVTIFLKYVDEGSSFVYGFTANPPDALKALGVYPVFLFNILSVVIFFSSLVAALFHWGVIQWVIARLGWFFQKTLSTTSAESMVAAANIFIGQTESPLLIKPYIAMLTSSEIHAIMTSGFSTIAGSVFGAYVGFGACPVHILTASIMSAPAALAMAKLFMPETEKSRTKDVKDLSIGKSSDANVLDAVSRGAIEGMQLVFCIGANLISFIAFLAFFNNVVGWLGRSVGIVGLTFERLCAYVFYPVAYLIGASDLPDPVARNAEVSRVSELIGIKTIVNEFVAYQRMGQMIHCCQLSVRAQIAATYSLCGFSNMAAIGIQIGGISALCPDRRGDIARVAFRAMCAGTFACLLTACVAGILTENLRPCGADTSVLFGNVDCVTLFGSGCSSNTTLLV